MDLPSMHHTGTVPALPLNGSQIKAAQTQSNHPDDAYPLTIDIRFDYTLEYSTCLMMLAYSNPAVNSCLGTTPDSPLGTTTNRVAQQTKVPAEAQDITKSENVRKSSRLYSLPSNTTALNHSPLTRVPLELWIQEHRQPSGYQQANHLERIYSNGIEQSKERSGSSQT